MADPAKVRGFLNPLSSGGWDPTLACVMGGAVAVTAATSFIVKSMRVAPLLAPPGAPLLADTVAYGPSAPRNRVIDAKLLRGAAAFGLGWGLTGCCPGPAFLAAAAGSHTAQLALAGIIAGALAHEG